jgi:lipoate-protein ligase A
LSVPRKKNLLNTLLNNLDIKKELIAQELGIDSKNIIIKDHFLNSYKTVLTNIGEYKVEFRVNDDLSLYIESIVKIT